MAFDPMKFKGLRDVDQYHNQNETKHSNSNPASRDEVASAFDRVAGNKLFEGDGTQCYRDRMINAICNMQTNDKWKVNVEGEEKALLEAIADSFDSELDLYIQETIREAMQKFGTCSKGYTSDACLNWLAERGIRIDAIGTSSGEDKDGNGEIDGSYSNRVYTFSMVEIPENFDDMTTEEKRAYVYGEDAKVLQDENGNKGSIVFGDCLIPDGYAQGAEFNLSSILDEMGYECISKADFIGNEDDYFAMMDEFDQMFGVNSDGERTGNGVYTGVETIDETYTFNRDIQASVKALWGGSGSAPGTGGYSSTSDTDNSNPLALNEEQEAQEAEQAEKDAAASEKEVEAYKKDRLAVLIEQYKDEHDGEKPTGDALAALERAVEDDAKAIFKDYEG